MTSQERIQGLHDALLTVHRERIPGDFVECGVYLGGNVIIAKRFFHSVSNFEKKFYCYDTFEGMTAPGINDEKKAHRKWQGSAQCLATMDSVKEQFEKHMLLDESVIFVKGDVNETLKIKENLPDEICILRLDTDWYESTLTELTILYERLSPGGFLIIDDYGYWNGCKKAVHEFFSESFVEKNFTKLDDTGIMYQKLS